MRKEMRAVSGRSWAVTDDSLDDFSFGDAGNLESGGLHNLGCVRVRWSTAPGGGTNGDGVPHHLLARYADPPAG
jgi:hypothetical protein